MSVMVEVLRMVRWSAACSALSALMYIVNITSMMPEDRWIFWRPASGFAIWKNAGNNLPFPVMVIVAHMYLKLPIRLNSNMVRYYVIQPVLFLLTLQQMNHRAVIKNSILMI